MSSDFNKVYYNPSIYYRPGANADGTDQNVMNAGNTSNWTAVPTDAFGIQNSNQLGNSASTADLVSGYPDRAWCQSSSDSATGSTCVVNSGYAYPDSVYPYGRNGSGTPRQVPLRQPLLLHDAVGAMVRRRRAYCVELQERLGGRPDGRHFTRPANSAPTRNSPTAPSART